jgi:hypothetical protein
MCFIDDVADETSGTKVTHAFKYMIVVLFMLLQP